MPPDHVCAQCEANALANEAGGYPDLATECRAYCRRDHLSIKEFNLRIRAKDYARNVLVNAGRATSDWTDNVLSEAISTAFRAGHTAGEHDAKKGTP